MSKEAPGKSNEPGQRAEEKLAATLKTAPNEQTAPDGQVATSSQTASEIPARPPVAPRKNIIPPRRTAFENGNRAAHVSKRNWVPDSSYNAEISQQPAQAETPAEMDAPESNATQQPQTTGRDAADQPTASIPPVISQSAQTAGQDKQQGLAASMPVSWQAAPVMPISWQAAPEMPASWQPDQGAPTLAEAEPAWPDEDEHEKTRRDEEHIKQTAAIETQKIAVPNTPIPAANTKINELPRTPVPAADTRMSEQPTTPLPMSPTVKPLTGRGSILTRGRAAFLILLLAILVINVTSTGFSQFFGPKGWGSVFNSGGTGQNLLGQLHLHTPTPGAKGQPTATPLTPKQIADQLIANMTLDQKLGQMLMVSFITPYYSPQLDAMITQYHVGSVIEYLNNIESKSQIIALNQQIQQHGDLPMIVATDQEGGTVDRLVNLDGPEISATTLGATGDPQKAYQQGVTDAQNLATYGFNLNIAPVVDIGNANVYNNQLYNRTFGNDPTTVTQMAGAYLNGLQQSGKVLGTIKHFPGGLADTSADPHHNLPYITRSLNDLNSIDWAPYKSLISKGNVYSIMVTHELVKALDPNVPSSLSPKVVSILRNQLGFKGVIITDGLEMGALANYYTLGDAAVKAVEAGDDLMMDPGSPNEVAKMVDALKQAISSGAISQQRIDDSVERILLFKYQMGLLKVHP